MYRRTGVMARREDRSVVLRRDIMECWRWSGSLRGSEESCREQPVNEDNRRRNAGDRNSTMCRVPERADQRLRPLPANSSEYNYR